MKIQTFIFFDMETTGLITEKVMPKVTEIAMIAVTRESICASSYNYEPRVMHKLVLPINPERCIPPVVERMTKLSNEEMQLLKPIRCEVYDLISHFIKRFTPPICFVAHNGKQFDYPIFLWELKCMDKILEDKILCIDTLKMFQDFYITRDLDLSRSRDLIMSEKILNDEFNESLSLLDIETAKEVTSFVETESQVPSTSIPHDHAYSKTKIVKQNKRYRNERNNVVDARSSKNRKREKTPEDQVIRKDDIIIVERPKKMNIPRKRLDFGYEKPVNLKLEAIYMSMFRSSLEGHHSAEADCIAMLRCVTKIADFFLEWSDNYACPLISCAKKF